MKKFLCLLIIGSLAQQTTLCDPKPRAAASSSSAGTATTAVSALHPARIIGRAVPRGTICVWCKKALIGPHDFMASDEFLQNKLDPVLYFCTQCALDNIPILPCWSNWGIGRIVPHYKFRDLVWIGYVLGVRGAKIDDQKARFFGMDQDMDRPFEEGWRMLTIGFAMGQRAKESGRDEWAEYQTRITKS